MAVAEFKANFSEVVESMRKGEEIVISYGRKKEKLGVLIPYSHYRENNSVELGTLRGNGKAIFHEDFEMTEEELLSEK